MPAPHHPPTPRDRTAETAMLTVSIWHDVTRDPEGRHTGFSGFIPGHQMVNVFTYDTPASGRSPARDRRGRVRRLQRRPQLRGSRRTGPGVPAAALWSLSVGDMAVAGETALAVAFAGFARLRGTFNPVRVHEHGTPLHRVTPTPGCPPGAWAACRGICPLEAASCRAGTSHGGHRTAWPGRWRGRYTLIRGTACCCRVTPASSSGPARPTPAVYAGLLGPPAVPAVAIAGRAGIGYFW
jgi:hypothetical protein